MPYTPFIHPDSHTLAYRYTPLLELPIWTSPSGQTAEEVDALYSQTWPTDLWQDYLRFHGASEEEIAEVTAALQAKAPNYTLENPS